MWLFTRYGFFSISRAYSSSRAGRTMAVIRARQMEHLQALRLQFNSLSQGIQLTPKRDYPYRMVVPWQTWLQVLHELASEQQWSNFKQAAEEYQGPTKYVDLLHQVWWLMRQLQIQVKETEE